MRHEEEKGNQHHFNTTQEQVYIMFIIVPRKL